MDVIYTQKDSLTIDLSEDH